MSWQRLFRCNAEVIVSHNLKDFPRTALEPYSITVMGPSTFLRNLYELDPKVVADTLCAASCIDQQTRGVRAR